MVDEESRKETADMGARYHRQAELVLIVGRML